MHLEAVTLVEGVLELAFLEKDARTVVDFKAARVQGTSTIQ